MTLKLNISEKGKAWKLEVEPEVLAGKSLGDKIKGKEISPDLSEYELEITGATDQSGFAHKSDVEGQELRRVLLTSGWGMHHKPRKEGKKKVSTPKGLRLKKTVRGKTLSEKTSQVNINVIKTGNKPLKEIFPDQNKPKEDPKETQKAEEKPAEPVEKKPAQVTQEPVKEIAPETPKEETKTEEKLESTI